MDKKRIDSSFDIDMIIAEVQGLKDKRAPSPKGAAGPPARREEEKKRHGSDSDTAVRRP